MNTLSADLFIKEIEERSGGVRIEVHGNIEFEERHYLETATERKERHRPDAREHPILDFT
jgi:hypothetical protein